MELSDVIIEISYLTSLEYLTCVIAITMVKLTLKEYYIWVINKWQFGYTLALLVIVLLYDTSVNHILTSTLFWYNWERTSVASE